jgi:dihydroorotate dehydrogenase (NAD+) catalytic subunit
MIELAPNHKYGLSLKSPIMTASGAAGYGNEYSDLVDFSLLGAFVTNPVSLRPRKAVKGSRLRIHYGHMVVHTGLPNPGVKAVVHEHRKEWEWFPVPIIIHVLATTPSETAETTTFLSNIPGIHGIELGLADNVKSERAISLVQAAMAGDLPVIVRIPFNRITELAPLISDEGVSALTLTGPPRVLLPADENHQKKDRSFFRGRLYGPAMFPILLNTISQWARKLTVPIIACGGIQTGKQALACLRLGATAVQIDAMLWRNPNLVETLNQDLNQLITTLIDNEGMKEAIDDDENLESSGDRTGNPPPGT